VKVERDLPASPAHTVLYKFRAHRKQHKQTVSGEKGMARKSQEEVAAKCCLTIHVLFCEKKNVFFLAVSKKCSRLMPLNELDKEIFRGI
jgi:hypothetical protein